MQSSLFFALAASALAATTELNLLTESSNDDYNNLGLTGMHEGAGFNALNVGKGYGQALTYNDTDHTFSHHFSFPEQGTEFTYFLAIWGNFFDFGVIGDFYPFSIDNGYLAVNGSTDGFYVAQNLSRNLDVYGYSQKGAKLVVFFPEGSNKTELPDSAVPIKLKVHVNGTETSTTISFGAADATTAASSVASAPASTSAASASSAASAAPAATSTAASDIANAAGAKGIAAVVAAAGAVAMLL